MDHPVNPFFRWLHRESDSSGDVLASLILAAKEDAAMRERLMFVLRLPREQRAPLIRTALDEMRLRGEPVAAQTAFARLATDAEAQTALRLLVE